MAGHAAHALVYPTVSSDSFHNLSISRLMLTDFRSYSAVRIDTDGRPVVLTGPNGAGKTNLLEALSCLTPGRGLRRARLAEMARHDGPGGWAVAARIDNNGEERQIGVGCEIDKETGKERRLVRIDGQRAAPGELRELLGVQWLTPRMDRLFIEGKGERRRFLDRLVFAGDPAHARRVTAYETAMRERNQLLRERGSDPAWLTALEARMAEDGVAVAAARRAAADRLSRALTQGIGPFPSARLAIDGMLESWLDDMAAVDAEQRFAETLAEARPRDAGAGRALDGPHRSDLLVTYAPNGMPAAQCSTGEQKALLIAIVLANARLETVDRGQAPLLLLDEITAHLDEGRRHALFDEIRALDGQAWLTGTDRSLFAGLRDRAQFFAVQSGTLSLEE